MSNKLNRTTLTGVTPRGSIYMLSDKYFRFKPEKSDRIMIIGYGLGINFVIVWPLRLWPRKREKNVIQLGRKERDVARLRSEYVSSLFVHTLSSFFSFHSKFPTVKSTQNKSSLQIDWKKERERMAGRLPAQVATPPELLHHHRCQTGCPSLLSWKTSLTLQNFRISSSSSLSSLSGTCSFLHCLAIFLWLIGWYSFWIC